MFLFCLFWKKGRGGEASSPLMLRALRGGQALSPNFFRKSIYKITTYWKINVIERTPHFFCDMVKNYRFGREAPTHTPHFQSKLIFVYTCTCTWHPYTGTSSFSKNNFWGCVNSWTLAQPINKWFLIYFKHLILWIILLNKLAQRNLMNERVNQGTIIS